MATLHGRAAAITVGTDDGQALRITGLDFEFKVIKHLRREPNTAEIKIFNLSESSRQSMERAERARIVLEAGYVEDVHVIYEGDLRKAWSKREDTDIITTIESGDGERAFRESRVNTSFGPGTSVRSVMEHVAATMGVGVGNLSEQVSDAAFEGLGSTYEEGAVASGASRDVLTGLASSAGLEWSIQDGNLQLLQFNAATQTTAVLLSKDTGLIGSPSLDSENVLKARALLIPGIFPGRKVEVRSEFVTGVFRVTKASYTGETAGAGWYVDIEGSLVDA